MKKCHSCGAPWEGDGSPAFKASCESCAAYLHSCKNCRLHDPGFHNQCISRTTEQVQDREGPNWCEEFDFKVARSGPKEGEHEAGKDAWDELFGKKD